MTAPYIQGQTLAWIALDPDGLRVHRATVQDIEKSAPGDQWRLATDRGATIVDQSGVGANAVPLEPDIANELRSRGDGYLVLATTLELDRVLGEDSAMDLDDDLGLG